MEPIHSVTSSLLRNPLRSGTHDDWRKALLFAGGGMLLANFLLEVRARGVLGALSLTFAYGLGWIALFIMATFALALLTGSLVKSEETAFRVIVLVALAALAAMLATHGQILDQFGTGGDL